jgi:hypothetical protein
MWKRSMLRANRKIPESMPASAIATKKRKEASQVRHGVSHLPRRARVRTGVVCARLTGGDVGREFHTVTTGYNKMNGRFMLAEVMKDVGGEFKLSPPNVFKMAFIPWIR